MTYALHTPCWESEHTKLILQLGIPMILLYVAGIPLAFVVILHRNLNLVRIDIQHDTPADAIKQRQLHFQETYSFLYRGYRLEAYWWESIYVFRKALLTAVSVFFPNDYNTQGVFAVLIIVAAITAHVQMNPFCEDVYNKLETFSLWSTLVIFMCGQLTFTQGIYQSHVSAAASVLALMVLIAYLAVMILVACFLYYNEMRDQNEKLHIHQSRDAPRTSAYSTTDALPQDAIELSPLA